MPDPRLPGRAGLYLSMAEYGLTRHRDFAREHAPKHLLQGNSLGLERPELEDRVPASLGLVAIEDLEELLLLQSGASSS